MVELSESTYERIRKSVKTYKVGISSRTNEDYNEGKCDICDLHTKHMLSCPGCQDDGWIFCEHHARELGILW